MWISEQTATFALYIISWLVFITVVESVYCTVRTDSLYKADYFSSLKVKYHVCSARILSVQHRNMSHILKGPLTLTLLMWTKWWAPASASKWQMGFNSAFKGLKFVVADDTTYVFLKSNFIFPKKKNN